MKRFSILTLVLMITLITSACGAQTTPTRIAVDIQGTVAAAASTMIAETQAAIPTATPPPPTATFTDTPAPTNTLPPLPSSEGTLTPVPNANSGGEDPCINQPLTAPLQGETVRMRIDNSTEATLSLTVYLNQTGPQGECGYRSYTLAPGEFVVINNLVEGCYTLWAWNPDPDSYFIVTNGTNCIDNSNNWVFDISTGSIKLGT
ncbi:MAG TPA: hypothetical protein VJ821_08910 [Anaerolineales bacterium]|nr:hypothetical protein [Anaerolineales bacterium]